MQRLLGRNAGSVLCDAFLQQYKALHFLHHIQIIIAGSAVRPQRDCNAALHHLRNRGNAACQLQVGIRAMQRHHAMFFHDLMIRLAGIHAVCGIHFALQHAQRFQQRHRRFAMPFNAGIVLGRRFGNMDMQRHAQLLRFLPAGAQISRAACVFRMRAHRYADPPIRRALVSHQRIIHL